jgi:hypothetical protein
MDPDAPRRPPTAAAQRSLTHVQRWVMSVLAVTTILHLSVGLAIAAYVVPDSQRSGQVGLNVIAAAFGVIAVASGLAIHARPILSPWLLLGLVPGLVGLALVLR